MTEHQQQDKIDPKTGLRKRELYGRALGRNLSNKKEALIKELLPQINIDIEADKPYKASDFFDQEFDQYIFEIGFGYGDFIAEKHRKHSDTGFIGAEAYWNGIGQLLENIEKDDNSNIRLWTDDALIALEQFQENSLDGIYILNPDPWHKKRHYKRRIVREETLDLFSQLLKPGGFLTMTTDIANLAEWMVTKTINHPDFEWEAQRESDWLKAPKDWVQTKYEKAGIMAGRDQFYLIFKRK